MSGEISPESTGLTVTIEEKRLVLESGFLGRFFGQPSNAASNIAGVLVILLALSCICVVLWPSEGASLEEVWKYFGPTMTVALGYLFGRKS